MIVVRDGKDTVRGWINLAGGDSESGSGIHRAVTANIAIASIQAYRANILQIEIADIKKVTGVDP